MVGVVGPAVRVGWSSPLEHLRGMGKERVRKLSGSQERKSHESVLSTSARLGRVVGVPKSGVDLSASNTH